MAQVTLIDLESAERLRAEADPDPVVEEAAQRLRDALARLDATDEWGRPVAWRQVARIALGAVLPEVSRLLGRLPGGAGEADLLAAARAEVEWERRAVEVPVTAAVQPPADPLDLSVAVPSEPAAALPPAAERGWPAHHDPLGGLGWPG